MNNDVAKRTKDHKNVQNCQFIEPKRYERELWFLFAFINKASESDGLFPGLVRTP